ncbi:hypothetical protein ACODT5_19245 [Streptomyces sp. 5.8]|uniref:hypothetical protein n=1 Tax=Streptomyces sp. 5.8 TaxID=3406571 RepID=UPI003BB6BACD
MNSLRGTRRRLFVTGLAVTGALVLATGTAHATTTNVSGDVAGNYYTYYGTSRTITSSGSNIYLTLTDSAVAVKAFWYKCDDKTVHGQPVDLGDGRRKLIGSNFLSGTRFCIAAAGDVVGGAPKVPWKGKLEWNVYS